MYRPYRTIYLWKLKEIAKENWESLNKLTEIVSEMGLRKGREANFHFQIELGHRIVSLKKQQREQAIIRGIFEWPTTDAPASQHGFSGDIYWYKYGLLSFVGYKVGNDGESRKIRRNILDCVFHNNLPNVNTPQYMEEWANPETPERLKKIADFIATLTRNAKRNPVADYHEAIRNWEEDLAYLYNEYYVGEFGFGWPDPNIMD